MGGGLNGNENGRGSGRDGGSRDVRGSEGEGERLTVETGDGFLYSSTVSCREAQCLAAAAVHSCRSCACVCWYSPIFCARRWWRKPTLVCCHLFNPSILFLTCTTSSSERL